MVQPVTPTAHATTNEEAWTECPRCAWVAVECGLCGNVRGHAADAKGRVPADVAAAYRLGGLKAVADLCGEEWGWWRPDRGWKR